MEWGDAWPQLIGIATQGQGVDVSHVGSTWVSSLMTMNALRPIPPHVVQQTGWRRILCPLHMDNVVAEMTAMCMEFR